MENGNSNQGNGDYTMPGVQAQGGMSDGQTYGGGEVSQYGQYGQSSQYGQYGQYNQYNQGVTQYAQDTQSRRGGGLKTIIILMAVLAVFAIGGMVFGMVMLITKDQEVAGLNETVSELQMRLNSVTGIGTASSDVAVSDYIYVAQWGVKIKIPDELRVVSYDYSWSDNDERLGVLAVKDDGGALPNFVSAIQARKGGLGSITRTVEGYGYPYGKLIFSYNGYDYYFEPMQAVFSTDEVDIAMEKEAKSLVGTMLSNAENYSPIQE